MPRKKEVLNEVVTRVKDFNRRIRDLEEKVRSLNARVNTVEDTLFEKVKKLNTEVEDVSGRTGELEDRVKNVESELTNLERRTRKLVTRRELKELEDYHELISPIEQSFVTRDEVESIIDRKMRKKRRQEDHQ